MSGDLQKAISLIKSGDKEGGQTILIQILEENPQHDKAWIWMSAVVNTDEMRLECLEEALKIKPNNKVAQKGAAKLRNKLAQQQAVVEDDPEFITKPAVKTMHKRSILTRSPWITIWYMPRITIRAILETDPNKDVLLIAGLFGLVGMFVGVLWSMLSGVLTDILAVSITMIIAFILGPLIGIAWLYIMGIILSWTGLLLSGKGTAREIRTALAWGNIPMLTAYIIAVPFIFLPLLFPGAANVAANFLLGCMVILAVPFSFYAFYYVFLQSLAEAHQFSGWRALGTVMLPGILINCTIWLAAFVSAIGTAM